uniref:Phorbol-ester/DAG-type domain-containing protein n=1 Tax=Meloidogyne javanica TaxID=6303 RepID=A0A915LE27_MELJA
MQRRCIEVPRIGETFLEICNNDDATEEKTRNLDKLDPDQNRQAMKAIRKAIDPMIHRVGMYIVHIADEYSRNMEYWVLASDLNFAPGLLQAGSLQKDELSMFHFWLKLMFLEYKNEEEDEEDSAVEDISQREEPRKGTGGELSQNKVFLFAKKKGWTAVRTQKLIDKLWKQQRWIRVMKGDVNNLSRNKGRSNKVGDDQSIIRLHPCAMVEIEQLLFQLNVPKCVLCKRPIVVSRLSYTCEGCGSCYHANCMLREMEFPAKCSGQNCGQELDEEIIDEFEFDVDHEYIPPRRSQTGMSTSRRSATDSHRQPFPSLRD